MATKIHRQSFNSGLVSPDLWTRSDVGRFHHALRIGTNATIRTHGPIQRRPGSRVRRYLSNAPISSSGGALHEFIVDANTYYWIAIYPYLSASQLIVLSAEGLVLHTQDTDYLDSELSAIQFKQSYDVMFLQHPNHDTQRLERVTANTWRWTTHQFKGGPIGYDNPDRSILMSLDAIQWDAADTYAEGDVVVVGATDTLTGAAIKKYWHQKPINRLQVKKFYLMGIQPASGVTPFAKNDLITIAGTGTFFDGQWKIIDKDATYIYFNVGTYNIDDANWVNDWAGLSVAAGTISIVGKEEQVYISLQDANLNNNPTSSPTWWTPVDTVSGPTTIFCNQNFFTAEMVGKLIRFTTNDNLYDKGKFTTTDQDAVSKELPCLGTVQLTTEGGVWAGTLVLEQSLDAGATWEEIGAITSYDGERNGTVTRELTEYETLVRCRMKERVTASTSDTGCIWHLTVAGTQYIYATIQSYISPTKVQVTCDNHGRRYVTTWRWSLGAMAGGDGYPSCLDFYEERMIVSGIPGWPGVVFGSEIDNWEVWQDGFLETSPFKFTLKGGARNNVHWLLPMSRLVIGTDGSEHTLGARDRDSAMSGGNRSGEKRADFGVAPIPAISSGDRVFYVEAGGRNVRSMAYYWEKEGWDSDDMMGLCRHLLETETVTAMAFQRAPYSTLWCVRSDGKLLSFTFSQKEEVSAWTEHDLSGEVLNIATASASGTYDIAVMVKRTNGIYIETISPSNECLDFSYEMVNTHAPTFDLYAIEDEPNLIVEDAIGAAIADPLMATGGAFVHQLVPIGELIIKRDGVQLIEDTDYTITESELVWILDRSGTLTFFNGVDPLTEGVDYHISDQERWAVMTISDPTIDLSNLIVWWDVQTPTFFIQEDTRQLFVKPFDATGPGWDYTDNKQSWVIVEAVSSGNFTNNDWDVKLCDNVFSPANIPFPATVLIGLTEETLISPTDLTASPDSGGPGGNIRITQVELHLTNSMGGEVSVDDGNEWQNIVYLEDDTIPGQKLPLESGKYEVGVNSGWVDDGAKIRVRNRSSRQMTISTIGINVQRNKGRQA